MKQDVYTSEAQLQAMLDELEHAHDLDSKAHTHIARRKLFKLIGNLAGVLIIAFLRCLRTYCSSTSRYPSS